MKDQRPAKTRRNYDVDFKQEVIRMLASGRSAKDISEAFVIAEKRYAVAALNYLNPVAFETEYYRQTG
jgi:hypothetical protein